MNSNELQIGQTVQLPDASSGKIIRIESGTEYGDAVLYVTIINGLGGEVTRWVRGLVNS